MTSQGSVTRWSGTRREPAILQCSWPVLLDIFCIHFSSLPNTRHDSDDYQLDCTTGPGALDIRLTRHTFDRFSLRVLIG